MSDVTVKKLEEVEPYSGPNAIPGMKFRPTGRGLGVSAWGMNVIEIEAGCMGYPEHDHLKDGQEEVYALLRGSATLQAGGKEWPMEQGTMVRVGPDTRRKFVPGPKGAVLLALGATPGKAYELKKR
jgi:mannose-6-phosphate isomerase-like protein (cupin superfamily)